MASGFEISGANRKALFTLKLHRGDGMTLLGMNWRRGQPPTDFVGFAIEYQEPGGTRFFVLKNRIGFPRTDGSVDPNKLSTMRSPIQKFRWVHFPRNAELEGAFTYRVTPVFMNALGELSYGEQQLGAIELRRETYPGKLNLAFTRGFVSSQAFVDRYESVAPIAQLLPDRADQGLTFAPTHPKAAEALSWMGFEARRVILDLLDEAIADKKAQVRVVAYDLNQPEIVSRLAKLGARLKVIIDDDGDHGLATSGESQAAARLTASAGAANVKRQHMGKLQHNKSIVIDGPSVKAAVCGSTNFSWRGFFVQSNNAVIVRGKRAIAPFQRAFDDYWTSDSAAAFGATPSASWTDLGLTGVAASVAFSPHAKSNTLLQSIADDLSANTTSSLLYSLAFLYQTPGPLLDAIKKVTADATRFVYGISDRKVSGLDLQTPGGNVSPVFAAALSGKNVPEPFKSEPIGGSGTRMHHKFLVVDFDKPTARVYLGSYNFSESADTKNGENLVLVRDRRVVVSYMIEALRIFDHYHFRVAQQAAKLARMKFQLATPPATTAEQAWFAPYYTDARKIRDRKLFS
ncbi:MAG: phospholipase D-like domain-containing protein [Burkholderiales bacterium]